MLENLEQLTIAAVNGFAVGGGWGLALACDFHFSIPGAQYWFPEVDLGVPLSMGSTARLYSSIGAVRAKEVILTCNRYKAEELERWGMINRIFDEKELTNESVKFAKFLFLLVQASHYLYRFGEFLYSGGLQLLLLRFVGMQRKQEEVQEAFDIPWGNFYALVIGNNDYNIDLAPLETAVNDAKKIAEILEKKYGFIVQFEPNKNRKELYSLLKSYRTILKENDIPEKGECVIGVVKDL